MNGSLQEWAQALAAPEREALLLRAAETHPKGFTNAETIGKEWAKALAQRGFNALCPYARGYLAEQYMLLLNATAA